MGAAAGLPGLPPETRRSACFRSAGGLLLGLDAAGGRSRIIGPEWNRARDDSLQLLRPQHGLLPRLLPRANVVIPPLRNQVKEMADSGVLPGWFRCIGPAVKRPV